MVRKLSLPSWNGWWKCKQSIVHPTGALFSFGWCGKRSWPRTEISSVLIRLAWTCAAWTIPWPNHDVISLAPVLIFQSISPAALGAVGRADMQMVPLGLIVSKTLMKSDIYCDPIWLMLYTSKLRHAHEKVNSFRDFSSCRTGPSNWWKQDVSKDTSRLVPQRYANMASISCGVDRARAPLCTGFTKLGKTVAIAVASYSWPVTGSYPDELRWSYILFVARVLFVELMMVDPVLRRNPPLMQNLS